jgi:hypothetical protein
VDPAVWERLRRRIVERLGSIVFFWLPWWEAREAWNDAEQHYPHRNAWWGEAWVRMAFERRNAELVRQGFPPEGWLPYTDLHDRLTYQQANWTYGQMTTVQQDQLVKTLSPVARPYWEHASPRARAGILADLRRYQMMKMRNRIANAQTGPRIQPASATLYTATITPGETTTDPWGNQVVVGPRYDGASIESVLKTRQ